MTEVAAIQMVSGRDLEANLLEAGRLLAEAARAGALLAVPPPAGALGNPIDLIEDTVAEAVESSNEVGRRAGEAARAGKDCATTEYARGL